MLSCVMLRLPGKEVSLNGPNEHWLCQCQQHWLDSVTLCVSIWTGSG